jgi:RNA polymerase sigma factor (sigma-70 family)
VAEEDDPRGLQVANVARISHDERFARPDIAQHNRDMSDVTHILSQIESGNPAAAEQLLPLVYDELRKLAAAKLAYEKPGQTLQATALVHEAYLRLVGGGQERSEVSGQMSDEDQQSPDFRSPIPVSCSLSPVSFDSRGHFFAAAAEAMRRILIDQARRKESLKRGGDRQRQDIEQVDIAAPEPSLDMLALDAALERFERLDPSKAELVKLRYFAGLTIRQAAAALGISATTADRHWAYARAWLHAELARGV